MTRVASARAYYGTITNEPDVDRAEKNPPVPAVSPNITGACDPQKRVNKGKKAASTKGGVGPHVIQIVSVGDNGHRDDQQAEIAGRHRNGT